MRYEFAIHYVSLPALSHLKQIPASRLVDLCALWRMGMAADEVLWSPEYGVHTEYMRSSMHLGT
jgi:hypothetical protein